MKPWDPWKPDPADASALQAVNRGEGTPDQQRRVIDLILGDLSLHLSPSFHPEPSGRIDAFIEGRRWVGLAVRTAIKTDPSSLVARKQAIEAAKQPKGAK